MLRYRFLTRMVKIKTLFFHLVLFLLFFCILDEEKKRECDVTLIANVVCEKKKHITEIWQMIFAEKLFSWLPPIILFVCFFQFSLWEKIKLKCKSWEKERFADWYR